jgi:predicted nucleic acid-binding Zn ribbon protein
MEELEMTRNSTRRRAITIFEIIALIAGWIVLLVILTTTGPTTG